MAAYLTNVLNSTTSDRSIITYSEVGGRQNKTVSKASTATAVLVSMDITDCLQSESGGEVKGKLANGVGSQYSSNYLGTWCIQHYYR